MGSQACALSGKGTVLTIVGLRDTFDYYHVGGLDSFYRRTAFACLAQGVEVLFLHYGHTKKEEQRTESGVVVRRVRDFKEALELLDSYDGPVIVNAIHRSDRPAFMQFRRARKERSFHIVYSVYSESRLRRELYMMESLLAPFNGTGLALSPRLAALARKRRNRAEVFLPPVDDLYFCEPRQKPRANRLRLTYMGRIDPGKGIHEVVRLFRELARDGEYHLRISGYVLPGSESSRSLHEELLRDNAFIYEPVDYARWSAQLDEAAALRLRETDILILPYARLSSTVDMPLLLLEGMAAGCAVLTKPLGDIPAVYGSSPFLVTAQDFVPEAARFVRGCTQASLKNEQQRAYLRAKALELDREGTFARLRRIVPLDYGAIRSYYSTERLGV